jgi:hypothetical protein
MRPDDAGLSERVQAHLATHQAKHSLRRRGGGVETATAELKEHHGLHRAHYRGRAKVQRQAYGAAIGYNVKNLVAGIRRRPVRAAGALQFAPRHCSALARPAARGRERPPLNDFGNRPHSDQ